jgi:DNA-binding NtrC family response regulator
MATVLIVDDEPDHSDFLAAFLRRNGYATRSVPNGRDALQALLNNGIEAVILDVRMPGMSGVDLLEIVRSYLRWQSLPVILVTAHGTQPELDRAMQLGVACVFQKANFKLVDLLGCLQRVVPPAAGAGGA